MSNSMIQKNTWLSKAMSRERVTMPGWHSYQELCNEIDDIIIFHGQTDEDGYFLRYVSLDLPLKQKISSRFIAFHDNDIFCIYQNDRLPEIVSSLLDMLNYDTSTADQDFLEQIKEKICDYYEEQAQALIDERCMAINYERRKKVC